MFLFVFFFKQKTAYEMRISDWSSDVCSSDLPHNQHQRETATMASGTRKQIRWTASTRRRKRKEARRRRWMKKSWKWPKQSTIKDLVSYQIGRASCRERVCQYV